MGTSWQKGKLSLKKKKIQIFFLFLHPFQQTCLTRSTRRMKHNHRTAFILMLWEAKLTKVMTLLLCLYQKVHRTTQFLSSFVQIRRESCNNVWDHAEDQKINSISESNQWHIVNLMHSVALKIWLKDSILWRFIWTNLVQVTY